MHLKLSIRQKLRILVAAALAALVLLSLLSLWQTQKLYVQLNSLLERQHLVVATVDQARGAQVHFKTQVQEWKNVLLRGKDAEAFDKHLKGFRLEAEKVRKLLDEAGRSADALGIGNETGAAAVTAIFSRLTPAYEDALKKYDRAAADPAQQVDRLVRGIDRAPTVAIDELVNKIQVAAANIGKQEKEAAEAIHSAIIVWTGILAVLATLIVAVLSWWTVRSITPPLDAVRRTMGDIAASGDLTRRSPLLRHDEIGNVAAAFNDMLDQFQPLIRQLIQTSAQIHGTANGLTTAAGKLHLSADQQSTSMTANAAAIEELSASIMTVADTADEVRRLSGQSVDKTENGNRRLDELLAEMTNIRSSVEAIAQSVGQFVDSTSAITQLTGEVKGIADQTNLLALNAAIEAARAGEAGRGFAVVADEVRKLAENSARSAGSIDEVANSIIEQSHSVRAAIERGRQSIDASAALTGEVAAMLGEARDAVITANRGIDEISLSVGEQRSAGNDISQTMVLVAQASEETAATANDLNIAAGNLQQEVAQLETAISRFRA